jgi:hypothetical protein
MRDAMRLFKESPAAELRRYADIRFSGEIREKTPTYNTPDSWFARRRLCIPHCIWDVVPQPHGVRVS